eukprot:TRINITY_DN873_c0_g1_i1.p1 TRINITY_DN873_c0_g1~~TRINITY_DN873_c0_g1_i1.p1  ORF type:complete len:470 (+),score=89.51 TRINITY_DN873_c0_g1_i1:169-1410(+)
MTNRTINKLKFRFEPTQAKECAVEFVPSTGVIPPGKDKKVKVSLILLQSTSSSLKSQVLVETTPYFIGIRIRCASGVFGADPSSLDQIQDGPFKVPEVLLLMKNALMSQDALKAEGIFRLAGEVSSIAKIKSELNAKTFSTSDDVNAVATLIKVWFRELPRPLLQSIPTDTIFNASSPDALSKAYNSMQQPEKDLLGWLMDLLLATSEHQKVNKMTPQNLSICVAPNLYDVSSSDPMEGLVLSQKVVVFLTNLLNWQAEQRTEAAAVPQRPGHAPPASLVLRASAAHIVVNSSASSSSTDAPAPTQPEPVTVPLVEPPPPTAPTDLDSQPELPPALPQVPPPLAESIATVESTTATDAAAAHPAPIAPLDAPPTSEEPSWSPTAVDTEGEPTSLGEAQDHRQSSPDASADPVQ